MNQNVSRVLSMLIPDTANISRSNYRLWLHQVMNDRQTRNPAYSLRGFAKTLGVSHSSLSQILSGKRPLTKKSAVRIADRLSLSPEQRTRLIEIAENSKAITRKTPKSETHTASEFMVLEMDQFRLISEWYHYAILCLLEFPRNSVSPEWLATRLGIPQRDVVGALGRLQRLGLIDGTESPRLTLKRKLATSTETSPALRKSHRTTLQKAEVSLETDPVTLRDFSSVTMAIDPDLIPQAKEEIRRFRRALSRFLESGTKRRVYTLGIQLFPIDVEELKK